MAGVCEYFILLDSDQRKDPNAMCEVISMTLSASDEILRLREVAFPLSVVFHSDNCARELKNQVVAKMGAWLANRYFPYGASHTQQEKGHSHGPQDRRFGVASTALARCTVLETPQAFCRRIEDTMSPMPGMQLKAFCLLAVHDWTRFFSKMNIQMKGHTGPTGCHVWKSMRRSACSVLPEHIPTSDGVAGDDAHSHDVFFLQGVHAQPRVAKRSYLVPEKQYCGEDVERGWQW